MSDRSKDILHILKQAGLEGTVSAGEFVTNCVFHRDENPSLSIRLKDGVFHCFGCGESGRLSKLVEALGIHVEDAEDGKREDAPRVSWKRKLRTMTRRIRGLKVSVLEQFPDSYDAYAYFVLRGIPPRVCKLYDVRQGTGGYVGRVVIPIRDEKGNLISFMARHMTSNDPTEKMRKYPGTDARSVLFGADVVLKHFGDLENVVVVEGEIDAMSGVAAGIPAVALMGKTISRTQRERIVQHCTEVRLCLDADASEQDIAKVARSLRDLVVVKIVRLREGKDFNEVLMEKGRRALRDQFR